MIFEPINEGLAYLQNDSNNPILYDVQSALDLIATAWHMGSHNKLIIKKEDISDDFFDLKTKLLGEITQKFINYNFKIAIVGDFSSYTSKSLKDFIYESNKGSALYFANTTEEAIKAF